jgi:gamma-glutamylcyclotransferase (GGCT)/AIG2-like uncharacterized protein YtfP
MTTDTTTTQLPIAVYGTLRVGYHNHRHVAGRTAEITPGVVDGYQLVVEGLPYARPSTTGHLVVEVMWPLPHIYDDVLADLDRLEGYSPDADANHYTRTQVTVTTTDGAEVDAWLYEAGEWAQRRLRSYPTVVASGDYTDVRTPAGRRVPA